MVLRREEDLVPRPLSHATYKPPYPTTPSEEHVPQLPGTSTEHQNPYAADINKSPAFQLKLPESAQKKKDDGDESDYSDNEWDQSDDETPPDDLPNPLKIGGGKPLPGSAEKKKDSLPDILKAGPPKGIPIRKAPGKAPAEPTTLSSSVASNASGNSAPLQTNNPYLKIQQTGQSNFGGESSESVWGDAPAHSNQYSNPVELPTYKTPDTPTNPMANSEWTNKAPASQTYDIPDKPPAIAVDPASPLSAHSEPRSDASGDYHPGIAPSSLDAFAKGYNNPASKKPEQDNQHLLLQKENENVGHDDAVAMSMEEKERRHAESLVDIPQPPAHSPPPVPEEPAPPLPPNRPPPTFGTSLEEFEEPGPALPPRRQEEEQPPPMPLRPLETGIIHPTPSGPESPNTVMNRQRKETYQIKHIRWHDVNKQGIRTSPILTQNINGPCPLLALVNALVLSTPANVETALVETLRTREQVSLGLLLDAVFDELMSGRRGDAAQELPDVSDLYKFLLALHTGLNVNPTFVQDPDSTDGTSTVASVTARPGGFENTRDMRLYRTFNLALMHGWLPDPNTDAYRAFDRIAKTYETSQYVQFQEEELEAKLQTGEALSTDEQQMFTDIHAIKEFLNTWPTQLTTYGLKTMRATLQPGQVAILFRNDHFSTLYKDPRTDNLVTLVTDQGYSSHDEIVWESLVDVNGQGSELFSGDFRPVGNNISPQISRNSQPVQNMHDPSDDQGWTTVQRRGNQQIPASGVATSDQPQSGPEGHSTEQEDHDLALALQLQEEEDDRHRRAQEERRNRENQLSMNAITSQAQQRPQNPRTSRPDETPPAIPPRRNNVQTHRPTGEPAPPPTYEEAATAPKYNPPQGHPANPNAPVGTQGPAYQRPNQPLHGRRPSRPMSQQQPPRPGQPNGQEQREKCVVM